MQQLCSQNQDVDDLQIQFERMVLTLFKGHQSILQKKYDDAYDQLSSVLQPLKQLQKQLPKEKREILENELVLHEMVGTRTNRRTENITKQKKRNTTKSIESKTGNQDIKINIYIKNININNNQVNNTQIIKNQRGQDQTQEKIEQLKKQQQYYIDTQQVQNQKIHQLESLPTAKYESYESQKSLKQGDFYHKAFSFTVNYFLQYCCLNEQTKDWSSEPQIIGSIKEFCFGIFQIIGSAYLNILQQLVSLIFETIVSEMVFSIFENKNKKIAQLFINIIQMSNKMNYQQVIQIVSFERAQKIESCHNTNFKIEKVIEVEKLVKIHEEASKKVKTKCIQQEEKFWLNSFWQKGINDAFMFLELLQKEGESITKPFDLEHLSQQILQKIAIF